MFRRLVLGAVVIAAFAVLSPAVPQPEPVEASPAYQDITITFASDVTSDAQALGEAVEFSRDEHVIWAIMDFHGFTPGTRLTYVLRLNGWDYTWGSFACCKDLTRGRLAFPLYRRDHPSKVIPGGAYTLYVYDGDRELGRAGFGVRGGRGSDNEDPESNS